MRLFPLFDSESASHMHESLDVEIHTMEPGSETERILDSLFGEDDEEAPPSTIRTSQR